MTSYLFLQRAKQAPVDAAVAAKVKAIFLKVFAQRKANQRVTWYWESCVMSNSAGAQFHYHLVTWQCFVSLDSDREGQNQKYCLFSCWADCVHIPILSTALKCFLLLLLVVKVVEHSFMKQQLWRRMGSRQPPLASLSAAKLQWTSATTSCRKIHVVTCQQRYHDQQGLLCMQISRSASGLLWLDPCQNQLCWPTWHPAVLVVTIWHCPCLLSCIWSASRAPCEIRVAEWTLTCSCNLSMTLVSDPQSSVLKA